MKDKTVEEAVETLQKEIKEREDQITLLQNLDFTNPLTEEKWHEVCDTQLRSSELLGTLLLNIFPDATDIKIGCNYVKFNLYGFDCKIPTSREHGIRVDMNWTYFLFPKKLTGPYNELTKRMKEYFDALDNHASWETLFNIRLPRLTSYNKCIKWILWFGKYKWKNDHRNEWEEKFKKEELTYQENLKKQEENKEELKKRIELLKTQLLPILHTFTDKVYKNSSSELVEETLEEMEKTLY